MKYALLFGKSTNRRRLVLAMLLALGAVSASAQVAVTATGGTASGSYPTLAAAFAAVNAGTHQGSIRVNITASTTEPTTNVALVGSGTGSAAYSAVAIQPTANGLTVTCAGTLTLGLSGASNVTLDGRPNNTAGTVGTYLTVANTNAAGTALAFTNNASATVVQYCLLKSTAAATGTGVVSFAGGTAAPGNSNNTLRYNGISGGGASYNLIYAGSGTVANTGNVVSSNNLADQFSATSATSGLYLAGGTGSNSGWTITGNALYQSASRTYTTANTHVGINVGGTGTTAAGTNYTISNNLIGGGVVPVSTAPLPGTPAATYTLGGTVATRFVGIWGAFGSGSNVLKGNVVQGFSLATSSGAGTTYGVFAGIYLAATAGDAAVGGPAAGEGNTIGSATTAGSIAVASTTTAGVVFGISSAATGTLSFVGNTVAGLTATGSTASIGAGVTGMLTAAGTNTLTGNTIGTSAAGLSAARVITSTSVVQAVRGIVSSSATGTTTIAGNTIGYLSNAGTAANANLQTIGILTSAGSNVIGGSAAGANTVSNLSNAGGVAANTNSNGTSATVGPNSAVIGIAQTSTTAASQTVSYNAVSGFASTATGTSGIGIVFVSTATGPNVVSNNVVSNSTASGSSAASSTTGSRNLYGIYSASSTAGTYSVLNNQVYALANNSAGTTGNGSTTAGILTVGSTPTLTGNLVYDISNSATAATSYFTQVTGLDVTEASGLTATIAQNRVYNVRSAVPLGTSGYGTQGAQALHTSGAGTFSVYNNFLALPGNAGTGAAYDVLVEEGSGGTLTLYYNTLYLSGSSLSGPGPTAALYFNNLPTTLTARNNICYNEYAGGSQNYAVALVNAARATLTTSTTFDYNLYVTASAATMGQYQGSDLTFAQWQAATSGDANAGYNLPADAAVAGSSAALFTSAGTGDLHIQASAANAAAVVGKGTAVSVMTDYDGDTRRSVPDLGADETFIPLYITLTSQPASTTSTANQTVLATITSTSGVGSGANAPRIYYRKSTSSYVYTTGTLTGSSGNTYSYTFTIDYAVAGYGTPAGGDVVQYYVAAQSAAATPAGASAPVGSTSTNPPGTAFMGTPASYTILATLAGPFNVGTGQPYTSLTGTTGLFNALNNGVLSGNVQVYITSDLSETGAVTLNALQAANSTTPTLTIQPDGPTLRTISGSYAANSTAGLNGLLRLSGAANVTFTGGTANSNQASASRYLALRNAGTAPVVLFLNGAAANALTNSVVESASATGSVALAGTTGTTLAYNDLRDLSTAPGVPAYGVYATGSNATVTVRGNTIRNFTSAGVYGDASASAWTVGGTTAPDGNLLYQEASRSTALAGVQLLGGSGHTLRYNSVYQASGTLTGPTFYGLLLTGGGTGHLVSNNTVGGAAADASGAALTTSGTFVGIYLPAVGTSTTTTVQANVVSNLTSTATSGSSSGLRLAETSGSVTIGGSLTTLGNTVAALTVASTGYGLYTGATGASTVQGNTVRTLTYAGVAADVSLYGLYAAATGSYSLTGNTVAAIANNSYGDSSGSTTAGIVTASGSPTLTGNIVSDISNAGTTSAGGFTQVVGLDATNNSPSATATVTQNRVYNVRSTVPLGTSGYGTQGAQALHLGGSSGFMVANNLLALPGNAGTSAAYGLLVESNGATTTQLYYNSVYLGGSLGGTGSTAALYFNNVPGTLAMVNNIFYNQYAAGTGNYAVAVVNASRGVLPATASDYNLFVTASAAQMGQYGGSDQTLAQWRTATGGDANSSSYLPADAAVAGSSANLFAAASAGDLHLKTATAPAINDQGTALGAVTTDYDGQARSSTPDLGADEFAAPLPVQLVLFEATRQGEAAALRWRTASEQNNRGFEVQLSLDGQAFRMLGFVAGAGSSASPHDYAYLDQETGKAGLRYYRLRQLDQDGTATYSPVRAVAFDEAAASLTALPSPFGSSLSVLLSVPAAVPAATELTLTDALGRVVRRQALAPLPAGASRVELTSLDGLAAGLYLLRLPLGRAVLTRKVNKQ